MSSIFRSIAVGSVMAVVAMVATLQAETPAERQVALRNAARAAIYGPEVKKIKVAGHEFNVKRAKIETNHEGTIISGQISHHLSLRSDDQLYYSIKKIEGAVFTIQVRIERGGLAPLVTKVAGDDVGQFLSKLGQKIDGKWESAADLIVAQIAKNAPGISPSAKKAGGSAPYQPKSSKK